MEIKNPMAPLSEKTTILGYDGAYHLLRRSTYCINRERIQMFAQKTPKEALGLLFDFKGLSAPVPLNGYNETVVATYGGGAVTDTHNTDPQLPLDRSWWLYNALKDETAQHRLAFLLHLFFIVDDAAHIFNNFDYKELLRFHCNGSLRDLARRMTKNPRMLIYLNNDLNHKAAPNQNYAREFLELFTILKGPQRGAGDYTNYTEHDVQQAARVLTGFSLDYSSVYDNVLRLNNVDPDTLIPQGIVKEQWHDAEDKVFSGAFGQKVIFGASSEKAIEEELQQFVDMVFAQEATALSYCRRIYRYYVGREISPEIEETIITPLAEYMRANDYHVSAVVQKLLSCRHFYDEADEFQGDQVVGALVRSPMELYFHMLGLLEIDIPDYKTHAKTIHDFMYNIVFYNSFNAGMPIFQPATVDGYAGYGGPNYDKNFVTASTLHTRYHYTIDLLINGLGYNGDEIRFNAASFVRYSGHFSKPMEVDALLQDFVSLLFVKPLSTERFREFEAVFLSGLSASNWLFEWNHYMASGIDTNVNIPLGRLVRAMIKSPEFQVM